MEVLRTFFDTPLSSKLGLNKVYVEQILTITEL